MRHRDLALHVEGRDGASARNPAGAAGCQCRVVREDVLDRGQPELQESLDFTLHGALRMDAKVAQLAHERELGRERERAASHPPLQGESLLDLCQVQANLPVAYGVGGGAKQVRWPRSVQETFGRWRTCIRMRMLTGCAIL